MYFGNRPGGFLAAVEASGANKSGHYCGLHRFHAARRISLQYEFVGQSIEQMERRSLSIAEARKVYGTGVGIQKRGPKAITPVTAAFAARSQKARRLEAKNLLRHRWIDASVDSRVAHV